MIRITLDKAEKDLAHFIDRTKTSEEVVIAKGDEPIIRPVAVAKARK